MWRPNSAIILIVSSNVGDVNEQNGTVKKSRQMIGQLNDGLLLIMSRKNYE